MIGRSYVRCVIFKESSCLGFFANESSNDPSDRTRPVRFDSRRARRNASTVLRSFLPRCLSPRPSVLLRLPYLSSSSSSATTAVSFVSERAGPHRTCQPVALIARAERDVALLPLEESVVVRVAERISSTTRLLVSRAGTNSLTALTIGIPRGRRSRCRGLRR